MKRKEKNTVPWLRVALSGVLTLCALFISAPLLGCNDDTGPSAQPGPGFYISANASAADNPFTTPTPTPKPSATPEPSATPTPEPSATPTPEPSATPTPKPTTTPTPTLEPTTTPTPAPSTTPTPSATPTPGPSSTPTRSPIWANDNNDDGGDNSAPPPATYIITYDANGGDGMMSSGTATAGYGFTLPACAFTAPAGRQFAQWAIGSNTGTRANAGDTFSFTASTTVYAIWESISVAPQFRISLVYNLDGQNDYTSPSGASVSFTNGAASFSIPNIVEEGGRQKRLYKILLEVSDAAISDVSAVITFDRSTSFPSEAGTATQSNGVWSVSFGGDNAFRAMVADTRVDTISLTLKYSAGDPGTVYTLTNSWTKP